MRRRCRLSRITGEHPAPFVRHYEFRIECPVEATRDEIKGKDRDDRIVDFDAVPVERDLQAVEPPARGRRGKHDAGGQCVRGLRIEVRIAAHEPPDGVGGIVVVAKAFVREALSQTQRLDLCPVGSVALGAACLARVAGRVRERRQLRQIELEHARRPHGMLVRTAYLQCIDRSIQKLGLVRVGPAGRGVLRISVTHDGLERTDAGPIREQRNRRLDVHVGVVILAFEVVRRS